MKSNKEYHFKNNIESVHDVINALRDAGYSINFFRRCDLDGRTINYRLVFLDMWREYEITDLDDCIKLIVNDAVLLGEMIKVGAIVED